MSRKIKDRGFRICHVLMMAVLVFCSSSNADDDIRQKVAPGKNKHEVQYSEFEKDGVLYRRYDFGKAVFTVDVHDMANYDYDKTAETYLFWPGLISSDKISHDQAKKSSAVRILVDFTDGNRFPDGNDSFEYWKKYNCESAVGSKDDNYKKFWCYREVESEYAGLRKFVRGGRKADKNSPDTMAYIAVEGGVKSPQGRPLVINCSVDLDAPVGYVLRDVHCGTNFHYYDQVSMAIQFRGDVMPQWKDLVMGIDTFFKSRMREK